MNPTETLDTGTDALLQARLSELVRAMDGVAAPPELEAPLLARFRREHRPARRPSLWWMPPLALAATLAIVAWMIRGAMPPMQPALQAQQPRAAQPVDDTPFLALRPLERIALEPGTHVVTAEFPRALLADWGLPVAPDRAGEPVRAEMLYSADGEALAVRLIH